MVRHWLPVGAVRANHRDYGYYVRCTDCGVQTPRGFAWYEKMAQSRWNTREAQNAKVSDSRE